MNTLNKIKNDHFNQHVNDARSDCLTTLIFPLICDTLPIRDMNNCQLVTIIIATKG